MADPARILEALVGPIGLIWLASVIALVVFIAKRRWSGAVFCCAIAAILFVVGSTSIPNRLLASLEKPYAGQKLEEIGPANAVVMLGGVLSRSPNDPLRFNFHEGADRTIAALELMRRQKAPVLVLGGGGSVARHWTESEFLTNWFSLWQLPVGRVVRLPLCANTREEALRVQTMANEQGWRRILLVTSAYHMKRAQAIFRKLDMETVPVACDFVGLSLLDRAGFNPVPTPAGFESLWLYTHEQIGWWMYRWRGWIEPDPGDLVETNVYLH